MNIRENSWRKWRILWRIIHKDSLARVMDGPVVKECPGDGEAEEIRILALMEDREADKVAAGAAGRTGEPGKDFLPRIFTDEHG